MDRDLLVYSKTYDDVENWFEKVNAKCRAQFVAKLFEKLKMKNVIEIGCGMHSTLAHFEGLESGLIIEPINRFISSAKIQLTHIDCIDFEQAKLEEYDKSFNADLVIVSCLLHEIVDKDLFLQKLGKLASSSLIHLNVPNADSFHRLLAKKIGLIKEINSLSNLNRKNQVQTVFDFNSLVALLEKNGFEVLEKGGFGFKPFTNGQLYEIYVNGILSLELLAGLWEMHESIKSLYSEIYVNIKVKRSETIKRN